MTGKQLQVYGARIRLAWFHKAEELGYGEDKLAHVLKRAGLLVPRKKRVRTQRRLIDYPYIPGEVGQMDVKHWKRAAYQYDLIDCATRIKYKRLHPGVNPAYTVDFLEHASHFFALAFTFATIQTDNGTEFVYDQLPQTKPDTLAAVQRWLAANGIQHGRIPPRSPHLNGRIERSHGVDKDRYKKLSPHQSMP